MRLGLLIVVSALVVGCSSGAGGLGDPSGSTLTTRAAPSSAPAKPPTSTKPSPAPTSPPRAGAAIADVIRWVEAGPPADASAYRSATRDGTTTDLGDDVAFSVGGSGAANCMTDRRFDGALACLVELADPPPQPPEVYGQWKGNWVDFEGLTAAVGSAHGDPGRFSSGAGAELGAGRALAFGDYRCRAHESGVVCVNYAHQSAIEFSGTGIEAFGCLQKVTPPADIGIKFSC